MTEWNNELEDQNFKKVEMDINDKNYPCVSRIIIDLCRIYDWIINCNWSN